MATSATPLHLCLKWNNLITGECQEFIDPLPVLIGRAESMNSIVLDSKEVSRQHAQLKDIDGQIVIFDQNSTNGTIVNGQRVVQAKLNPEECFQIGPFTLKVRLSQNLNDPKNINPQSKVDP